MPDIVSQMRRAAPQRAAWAGSLAGWSLVAADSDGIKPFRSRRVIAIGARATHAQWTFMGGVAFVACSAAAMTLGNAPISLLTTIYAGVIYVRASFRLASTC
jgi:hypothetical protein